MGGSKHHDFRLNCGEFDEVFIANASVHIERMDRRAWWIGIEPSGESGLPSIRLVTGIHDGVWYFNIEEDSLDPERKEFRVNRPACHRKHGA